MNFKNFLAVAAASVVMTAAFTFPALAANGNNTNGFNQYGYNDNARVFVGTCLTWAEAEPMTEAQALAYCGAYSNDKLVMKWNAQWDNCNAANNDQASSCLGATLTNEWNGMVPNGSGDTEHVKVIWVGSEGKSSPYWQPGGYSIWGSYEAIMDQGMVDGVHTVWAHAIPNGFGVSK